MYNFYFDESFHSRKVTSGSFEDNDYFNSYISTGIGINKGNCTSIFKEYDIFEKNQKNNYGFNNYDSELKSSIISKEHYKYGISSFKTKDVKLYKDFFDFLLKNDVIYYISICDKLEYLLLQCEYESSIALNKNACIYSIVKLINVYRPKKVVQDILDKNDNLISDLKDFLKKQLNNNKNIEFKKLENETIINLIIFLNNIKLSNVNYEFDYNFTYTGLALLINEIKISNVNVFVDKEGTNKIFNCAKQYNFNSVRQLDSYNNQGIRISDMFCGFISKMMRALYDGTKNNPDIPYTKTHLLNERWWDINQEQFELYKTILDYIKKYNYVYYGSYISLYCDLFSELMGLIYYFDYYDSYEKYREKTLDEHYQLGNKTIIIRLRNDIKRIE